MREVTLSQEDAMNMSDEQALKILKPMRDMMRDQHGCPISDAYFALERAIDALTAQQWISCSERLPKDGTYLCWEWQGFCYVDSFKDGSWELTDKCYTKCLAWMPLPEPYKEENNGHD